MTEFVIDLKLTADGRQLIAEVKNSAGALDDLTGSTKRNNSEAAQLRDTYQRGASSVNLFADAVKYLAGSYVLLKVVDYARDAALLSARYETLAVSMAVVGNNAGYTAAEMEAAAVGMQETGISMEESRQQALRLVQAHIDLANASKLARIAQDAAVIGNMNSSESFAVMIHGIQTGQTDVLRTIGINVNLDQSYQALARTLGISVNSLTAAQKTQAAVNAVMEEGKNISGTYEAAMGTAGKQLNSLVRYQENFKEVVGETFNDALAAAVGAFTTQLKGATTQALDLKEKGDLREWGREAAMVLAAVADGARLVGNTVMVAGISFLKLGIYMKQAYDVQTGNFTGLATYNQMLKDLTETQSGFIAGIADPLKISNSLSSMFDDIDRREQESAEKRIAVENEYFARAKQVAADYASYSAKVQIDALHALADSYGGDIKAEHGTPPAVAAAIVTQQQMDSLYKQADAKAKGAYANEESQRAIHDQAMKDEYDRSLKDAGGFYALKDAIERKYIEDSYQSQAAGLAAEMALTEQQLANAKKFNQPAAAETALAKMNDIRNKEVQAVTAYNGKILALDQATQMARDAIQQKNMDDLVMQTSALADQADALQKSNDRIGLNAEQLAVLDAKQIQNTIDVTENQLSYEQHAYALEKDDLAAYNLSLKISLLSAQIQSLSATRDATLAKPMLEEWSADVQQYSDVFKTGTENMLNHGLGQWHSFTESLKTTWKTQVADYIYKTFEQPFVVQIIGSLLGITASGAASAGGLANTAGTASSIGSATSLLTSVGSWFGNNGFSTNVSQLIAQSGSTLYQMGAESAGNWMMQHAAQGGDYATIAGDALSYYNAIVAVRDGQWGQAIGTAVGTYFGGPIGGAIGNFIGGFFGPGKSGPSNLGETSINYNSQGAQVGTNSTWNPSTPGAGHIATSSAYSDSTTAALEQSYLAQMSQLGLQAYGTSFAAALNSEGTASFYGGATGQPGIVTTANVNNSADMQLAASRVILQALKQSDMPQYLADLFSEISPSTLTQDQINKTLAAAAALKQLHDVMPTLTETLMSAIPALQQTGETTADTVTRMVGAFAAVQPAIAQVDQATQQAWSPETVAMVQAAGATMQQTTYALWSSQTDSLRGLISTFDGSVASTNALAAATQARYATEQQLVNQITADMGNIQTMFATSSEQLQLSVMDAQQKQAYFVNQANSLEDQLKAATDPAQVADLAKRLNDAENNAWSNLDDTQRKAMLDSYTKNFDEINAIVQQKLGQTLDQVVQTSGTDLPAQIADKITSVMDAWLAGQKDVTTEQKSVVTDMKAVFSTPLKVAATVDVTVNTPATAYVGIS